MRVILSKVNRLKIAAGKMKNETSTSLIKKECANYFQDSGASNKVKNYCCLLNSTCKFFAEDNKPRCQYFEKGVLPLNPELEFRYRKERSLSTLNIQATCKNCLEPFIRNSNKEKYCHKCKADKHRERNKFRNQRIRKAS